MSASDSSPNSSGTNSPVPGAEPEIEAQTEEVPEIIEPEAALEGLFEIHAANYYSEETESPDVDIIFVPGIFYDYEADLEDKEYESHGSGNSSWIEAYISQLAANTRVLRFKYDASKVVIGHRSREAIRERAKCLLNDLVRLRTDEHYKKRHILFVGHDIGGSIIKDALVTASLNLDTWGGIYDYSRIQVFSGCPQRSVDYSDMEDRIFHFIFSKEYSNERKLAPSAKSVQGLVGAVIEINSLFAESNVYLRSHIMSLIANSNPASKGDINKVFDAYAGVMGASFEKIFPEKIDDESLESVPVDFSSPVIGHINSLHDYIIPGEKFIKEERTLLSLASSGHLLTTVRKDNWATATETYQKWLKFSGPQILHVRGEENVREASEQIFYNLYDMIAEKKSKELVLYFSFDRWDVRCDSIRDLLSTFIAQVICHYSTTMSKWAGVMLERLNQEHGWTAADAIAWFNYFQVGNEFDNVYLVLNYFDQCSESSRTAFMKFVLYTFGSIEVPWKIVLTSSRPEALQAELSQWPCIDLDEEFLGNESDPTQSSDSNSAKLISEWLNSLEIEEGLRAELDRYELDILKKPDSTARYIFSEQFRQPRQTADWKFLSNVFGAQGSQSDGKPDNHVPQLDPDVSFEVFLNRVLRNIPDQDTVKRLMPWFLYSVRPLSIWEVATVLYIGSDEDTESAILPYNALLDRLILKAKTAFAGLLEVEHNEFRFKSPRVREVVMGFKAEKESAYIWDGIETDAHLEITKLCLNFLARPSVQDLVSQMYKEPESDSIEASVTPDPGNLCAYAVQAWIHHFSHIPADLEPSKLLDATNISGMIPNWCRGYWALSNPITRSRRPCETLFPIFAGVGLLGALEPLDENDRSLGLKEAAANGQISTVNALLKESDYPESLLLDTLIPAAASGEEEIVLNIMDHILTTKKSENITWPPLLLYRAAWLGFDKVVEKLLDLGYPADSDQEMRDKARATPLYIASRLNHPSVVQLLIKHNADVEHLSFFNFWGQSPITLAASMGHGDVVKLLGEQGKVKLEERDEDNFTPLYRASICGSHKALEALIELGADPNMGAGVGAASESWLPLVAVAEDGFLNCMEILIKNGADPNNSGPNERSSALQIAASNGRVEACRLLLEKGADPNNKFHDPPLLTAVIADTGVHMTNSTKLELAKLLVEYGVTIDAADEYGATALARAVETTNEPVLRFLLEHGAEVNVRYKENYGPCPLYFAASDQNETFVELLLEHGADPNIQSPTGLAAIHTAHPSIEITRQLLEHGADPNLCDSGGLTELLYVAGLDNENAPECLDLLIKHNANLESATDESNPAWRRWTSASIASYYGCDEILRRLAEAGANLKYKDADGLSPLHLAATEDKTLPVLMEFRSKVDLDQVDNNGETTLHRVGSMSLKNLKLLVHGGADLSIRNKFRETVLMKAAYSSDIEAIKFLLKHDVEINAQSKEFGSALHRACYRGFTELVDLLIEHGADVNYLAEDGCGTPLQDSCISPSNTEGLEIIKRLLKSGADLKVAGGTHGSVLGTAAIGSTPEVVKFLLEEKAALDVADRMGRLPIHFAAFRSIEKFQLILEAGGDMTATDKMGRMALHWAAQPARVEIIERLLERLPKDAVNQADIDGWTPLCWAARGMASWDASSDLDPDHQTQVIRLLLSHGADRSLSATVGEERWSPLKIARYGSANPDAVKLLKYGLDKEPVAEADAPEGEDAPAKPEAKDGDEIRAASYRGGFCCDFCYWEVNGISYTCEQCPDWGLCQKCYPHRAVLHANHPDHTFKEDGPEFDDVAASSAEGSEKSSAAEGSVAPTSVSSDDEDDDDDDEGEGKGEA